MKVRGRAILRRLWLQPAARAGLLLAALLCLAAVGGGALREAAPDRMSLAEKLQPPSRRHPLGTDQFGRDQLARILDGSRRSVGAAILVMAGALMAGLTAGIAAGLLGGVGEAVVMRSVDVMLAIPSLALALAISGLLGPGYANLLLALTLSNWAWYARLARSYVRLARARPDVIAARMAGIGWLRATAGHIVPGVAVRLAIVATLDLGTVIIGFASLSFLGLGVQPPDAEWGAMLAESRFYFSTAPWLLIAPATAIFLSVVAANLIGNGLREADE